MAQTNEQNRADTQRWMDRASSIRRDELATLRWSDMTSRRNHFGQVIGDADIIQTALEIALPNCRVHRTAEDRIEVTFKPAYSGKDNSITLRIEPHAPRPVKLKEAR